MQLASSLYGTVEYTEMVKELINTAEMQRLRKVSQLGFVELVYPDATHNRFTHCLGACFLATTFAKHLGYDVNSKESLLVQAAALMHDIGHASYSHCLEFLIPRHTNGEYSSHEDLAAGIVTGKIGMNIDICKKIPDILKKYDVDPEDVAKLITKKYEDSVLQSMISSIVDCDRLDYLSRDAHFTGARVGSIDTFRIIGIAKKEDKRVVYPQKAAPLIKHMLDARSRMYSEVYIHRTVNVAETMLKTAAKFSQEELRPATFKTDDEVLSMLRNSNVLAARKIAEMLTYRQLLKIAHQLPMSIDSNKNIVKKLKKMRKREIISIIKEFAGLKEDTLVLISFPKVDIKIMPTDEELLGINFEDKNSKKTNYSFFNVFCEKEVKEKVKEATIKFISSFM